MSLLAVVFFFFVPCLTDAATDEFSYNVTSGKAIVNCAFKFVYKLGGSKIDLRRSTVECFDLPRTIKVKDYSVSSECGSVFSISMTVTNIKATLTAGSVLAPSSNCKPEALTTEKPKPKRRCPYGYTYICPAFEDGSCLPRLISVCFKDGKNGEQTSDGEEKGETSVDMNREMPVEMRTPEITENRARAVSKSTKEEREEVIASCMCIPNMALYAGALVAKIPESEPEEGNMNTKTTAISAERQLNSDRNGEAETRASCSEKFSKNFQSGKKFKCSWVLVYTDNTVDLTKSKATCTTSGSKVVRPKDVEISTTCGSVITVDLTVTSKKSTISKAEVTSVGESCTCYVDPTTEAATTTTSTTTTSTTTTTTTTSTTTTTTTTTTSTTTTTTTTTTTGITGGPNGGGSLVKNNIFSPRFMNECACIEQGAIKKGALKKGK